MHGVIHTFLLDFDYGRPKMRLLVTERLIRQIHLTDSDRSAILVFDCWNWVWVFYKTKNVFIFYFSHLSCSLVSYFGFHFTLRITTAQRSDSLLNGIIVIDIRLRWADKWAHSYSTSTHTIGLSCTVFPQYTTRKTTDRQTVVQYESAYWMPL